MKVRCQSKVNQSPLFATKPVLGSDQFAPLEKSDVTAGFEGLSTVDVAILIEVIME